MKKTVPLLNILLFAAVVIGGVVYDRVGGLGLKAAVSGLFAVYGLVNLLYARSVGYEPMGFPRWMAVGFFLCMAGDVALNVHFLTGACLFALGHVCYFVAYCHLCPFRWADLLPVGVIFLPSAVFLLSPVFDFGDPVMETVCLVYALIISCMVGKAVSNFRGNAPSSGTVLAGCALFFFSDLMLVLNYFAGTPPITDTLCVITYYVAQPLLALSLYRAAHRRAPVTGRL